MTHSATIGRAQRRRVREGIFEVLVDHGRMRDDGAVVVEHRHLAFRVDRDEPGLVLFELVQVDVDALECEAFLLQRGQALQRVGGGGERIRNRVPDVALAVAVEIDGVLLEVLRHELGIAHGACP